MGGPGWGPRGWGGWVRFWPGSGPAPTAWPRPGSQRALWRARKHVCLLPAAFGPAWAQLYRLGAGRGWAGGGRLCSLLSTSAGAFSRPPPSLSTGTRAVHACGPAGGVAAIRV